MSNLKVACIQTNSKSDPNINIREVSSLIRAARSNGAELITTPEVVGMLEPNREKALNKAQPENYHGVLREFRALSRDLAIWLLIGSISIKLSNGKLANRSFLINPDGQIIARYTKIHMFDVEVNDGSIYRESATYQPGTSACLARTPWGLVGLTICYDIRFPALYRDLAKAGAKIIFIPSAFTEVTGEAHWHILQRARAIENGCFIVSAAQTGMHEQNRKTFGHSIIVDPWGNILADADKDVGFITADLDLNLVDEVRKKIPSLTHDREYSKSFEAC
ncbi:MAG: carbon-nitrogen hydrolase family protein [Nisaea sp.]|jgi:predicted amidohydrolase|nr:carbon-nitrogen hydrolase family protein [Nisaea sp.]|tara:strand:+ start:3860 stop:4693 length:834 start_codon:yes stop_codon:yes gene_type:complete